MRASKTDPVADATAAAPMALEDLATVEGLAQEFPRLLTIRTLRWQLRHRAENGLGPAVVRVGKRLLISRSRYSAWLAARAIAQA